MGLEAVLPELHEFLDLHLGEVLEVASPDLGDSVVEGGVDPVVVQQIEIVQVVVEPLVQLINPASEPVSHKPTVLAELRLQVVVLVAVWGLAHQPLQVADLHVLEDWVAVDLRHAQLAHCWVVLAFGDHAQ
jgi:hypothetical protein